MKPAIIAARPGGLRSAAGSIGSVCAPSGQVGMMQRKPWSSGVSASRSHSPPSIR